MYFKEGIHLPKVGEKSGKGKYTYDKYGQVIILDHEFDTLPIILMV